MNETSLNAKCEIRGLSSFPSALAHDLAYWDSYLQVALMKHIFVLLGFPPYKTKRSLQGMELQEKDA